MLRETSLLFIERSCSLDDMVETRAVLAEAISALNIDNTSQQHMLLCFTEACTNIIKHNDASQFSVTLLSSANEWRIVLRDDGYLVDDLAKADFDKVELDVDVFAEGGRGIGILAHYTNDIRYQYTDGENCLSLVWHKTKCQKLTLLLVEDDLIQRKIYHNFLSEKFHVIESDNGKDALTLIQQQTTKQQGIDLIVADIRMPKMSGIDLLEHINNNSNVAALPFIFLTAVDDQETMQNVNYLGIDSYLNKPIDKDSLLMEIEQVLARHQRLAKKTNLSLSNKISKLLTPNIVEQAHHFTLSYHTLSVQGGGDFLLNHQLANGDVLLIIGDVMGHDHQAKFFAHTYLSYLRGLLLGLDKTLQINQEQPGELIANLMQQLSNLVLLDSIACESLLTCQILYLNENNIHIVSAGHPAPMVLNMAGKLNKITNEGMVLGLIPDQHYAPTQIQLKQGERLFCYTDGFFESAHENISLAEFEQHILQSMKASQPLSSALAVDKIIDDFILLASSPVKDDTLLLLIDG